MQEDSEKEECISNWLCVKSVTRNNTKRAYALMTVNDRQVRFQLDTATDVDIICQKHVFEDQVSPTKEGLKMWNHDKVKPLGEAVLKVTNPLTKEQSEVRFIVCDNNFSCLLSLATIIKFGLMTVNFDKFVSKVTKAGDLGDLGEVSLVVDPNVVPKKLPARNIPLALEKRGKGKPRRSCQTRSYSPSKY